MNTIPLHTVTFRAVLRLADQSLHHKLALEVADLVAVHGFTFLHSCGDNKPEGDR